MLTTFDTDPNYWDTLATNELLNSTSSTEKFRITYEIIYKSLKCNIFIFIFICVYIFF